MSKIQTCYATDCWASKNHLASISKRPEPNVSKIQKARHLFLPKDPLIQEDKKIQPTKARCLATTTSPQGSVHEEPLGGRSDHLAAHGALAQLFGTMAVAADHMSAGHQDHGWAMLVTDGTRHAGTTGARVDALPLAGSLSICCPCGTHFKICTAVQMLDIKALEPQICQALFE